MASKPQKTISLDAQLQNAFFTRLPSMLFVSWTRSRGGSFGGASIHNLSPGLKVQLHNAPKSAPLARASKPRLDAPAAASAMATARTPKTDFGLFV